MLALVQTYPAGGGALQRHWPLIRDNSGADEFWIIKTLTGDCWAPEGVVSFLIGDDKYLDGSHLPTRLIDTLEVGLASDHQYLLCFEYDVIFQSRIRHEAMEHAVAAHRAGSKTWGSLANSYFHCPWLFHREAAEKFVEEGRKVVSEGLCERQRGQPSPPESSPDVFFALVCERLNQPVQENLWKEFSRNSFDIPGHLEQARAAWVSGVDCIHGCKSERDLYYILTGNWM